MEVKVLVKLDFNKQNNEVSGDISFFLTKMGYFHILLCEEIILLLPKGKMMTPYLNQISSPLGSKKISFLHTKGCGNAPFKVKNSLHSTHTINFEPQLIVDCIHQVKNIY